MSLNTNAISRPFVLDKRLQYNTIRHDTTRHNTVKVYCENTLSYNNGVHSETGPKSESVKARQLIYRYSTNTHKKIKS